MQEKPRTEHIPARYISPEVFFAVRRDELRPEVRSYADNLHAQILNLSQEYGAKNAEEFLELAKNPKMIPLEKILEFKKLVDQLNEVLEKGERPGISMHEAREILGQDYFGPEAVETAFGRKLEPEDIPEIPFSQAELERAKELGQFLVLRIDQASDGAPLTPEKILALWQNRADADGNGKFLYDNTRCKREDFYTKDTPVPLAADEPAGKLHARWALVGRDLVPNSGGRHYLDQTKALVDYVQNEVFNGQTLPREYSEAIQEFNDYAAQEFGGNTAEEIRSILYDRTNWKKYHQEFSNLTINQLTRHSPAEVFYDMQIRFFNSDQKQRQRFLERTYTWTRRCSSDGLLVNVGDFSTDGVRVGRWEPDEQYGNIGTSFSRTV